VNPRGAANSANPSSYGRGRRIVRKRKAVYNATPMQEKKLCQVDALVKTNVEEDGDIETISKVTISLSFTQQRWIIDSII
jgi:hypothetical protein